MSLLPSNATPLEAGLVDVTERSASVPTNLRDLWNVDDCPVSLLPWLAWTLSVDVWDPIWTEAQKRAVIRNAIFVHRHKGTRAALETALSSVSYYLQITEWWEAGGVSTGMSPYTFVVDLEATGVGIGSDELARIAKLIDSAKNLRSSYALNVHVTTAGDWYAAAATYCGDTVTIYPGS